MKVSDFTWDLFIYPRANKSQKTITANVEALGSRAQFPPIKVRDREIKTYTSSTK